MRKVGSHGIAIEANMDNATPFHTSPRPQPTHLQQRRGPGPLPRVGPPNPCTGTRMFGPGDTSSAPSGMPRLQDRIQRKSHCARTLPPLFVPSTFSFPKPVLSAMDVNGSSPKEEPAGEPASPPAQQVDPSSTSGGVLPGNYWTEAPIVSLELEGERI